MEKWRHFSFYDVIKFNKFNNVVIIIINWKNFFTTESTMNLKIEASPKTWGTIFFTILLDDFEDENLKKIVIFSKFNKMCEKNWILSFSGSIFKSIADLIIKKNLQRRI